MNATIEGVVRLPSEFATTTGSLPSITATHELVVPRSIPIIFPIILYFLFFINILFYLPENPDLPNQFVCLVAYITSNGVPKVKLCIFCFKKRFFCQDDTTK
jgi:hypothetical protein